MVGGALVELSYELIVGGEHIAMDAQDARAFWDDSPEGLRRGRRDGAFILWGEDELGRRVAPLLFRPRRGRDV